MHCETGAAVRIRKLRSQGPDWDRRQPARRPFGYRLQQCAGASLPLRARRSVRFPKDCTRSERHRLSAASGAGPPPYPSAGSPSGCSPSPFPGEQAMSGLRLPTTVGVSLRTPPHRRRSGCRQTGSLRCATDLSAGRDAWVQATPHIRPALRHIRVLAQAEWQAGGQREARPRWLSPDGCCHRRAPRRHIPGQSHQSGSGGRQIAGRSDHQTGSLAQPLAQSLVPAGELPDVFAR